MYIVSICFLHFLRAFLKEISAHMLFKRGELPLGLIICEVLKVLSFLKSNKNIGTSKGVGCFLSCNPSRTIFQLCVIHDWRPKALHSKFVKKTDLVPCWRTAKVVEIFDTDGE